MKTLKHNQEIRVSGFSKYANKITVGTARGYASEYGEDPEDSHRRATANGHSTAWTNQKSSVLTADYPGKDEALNAVAKATAEAIKIEDGETVLIEGSTYVVKVAGERFSDPVLFRLKTASPVYSPVPSK
jgi:hypothetical protein